MPLRRNRSSIAAISVAVATAVAAPPGAQAVDVPRFVDDAGPAGIDHAYEGGWEHFVGGGVAVLDCNADGFPDLYFAGGSAPATLYINTGRRAGPLSFVRAEDEALAIPGVSGAYPLDIDGDGILDLAVLRVGENALFRGLGDCRFEVANERWSFDGGDHWTTAFAAVWEAGATAPTLAFGNYVDRSQPGSPFGTCHDNYLYRPGEHGYTIRMALSPSYCTLSLLFSDWNRDGVPDIRVSNDRQYYRGGAEQLWRVPPAGAPEPYTLADGWRELKIWGMGIASHDLTGDGYPEYFLTSMTDNKLQALSADAIAGFGEPLRPVYEDIAFDRNALAHRPYIDDEIMPSTAWHAEFGDVNNDGMVDLFVAKGNVEGMVDFAMRDPNNLLLGQADGSFAEGAPDAGIVTFARARGAALADLNLDGLLDIVVVNRVQNVELWRNRGAGELAAEDGAANPMGNWAMIRLRQDDSNRDAVGAWVEVRSGAHMWRDEVTVGGGHAGGQAGWLHVGVGTAELIEVRVQWPDGTWGPWLRTFANQFLVIERGRERPLFWQPPETAG